MNWTEQRHPGEYLVEWSAPALLAAAIGWAAYMVSGTALASAGAAGAALAVGIAAMRRVSEQPAGISLSDFSIESIEAGATDELLLDDPLIEVAPDSRVVTLFEVEPETPGALVARISDYLGERTPHDRATAEGAGRSAAGDAGEALHEALANIRASLR